MHGGFQKRGQRLNMGGGSQISTSLQTIDHHLTENWEALIYEESFARYMNRRFTVVKFPDLKREYSGNLLNT